MEVSNFESIRLRRKGPVLHMQMYRPERGNAVDAQLIEECHQTIAILERDASAKILVVEGTPEVFCVGADFPALGALDGPDTYSEAIPERLYALWQHLSSGAFVSIAHVRGRANASGVGLAAACDIVIADTTASFSLSEMLFGILPACVVPFLARRIGVQRTRYMSLLTRPVTARDAQAWGLVDACGDDSEAILMHHIPRLTRLRSEAVGQFKRYMNELDDGLAVAKPASVRANCASFSDAQNRRDIAQFVQSGEFPWERN